MLLVAETLTTGGAETFLLRLASALEHRGVDVSIYVLRGELINDPLVQSIAPNIRVVRGGSKITKILLKLDRLFFRLCIDISLLRYLQARQLRAYLQRTHPDIIHAHLFSSDLVTAKAVYQLDIPWVSTMHGDYLAYAHSRRIPAGMIHDFSRSTLSVEKSVSQVIYIADTQREQLNKLFPRLDSLDRIKKIYNGYVPRQDNNFSDMPLALTKIPEGHFVVGMVARGIEQKGWALLIEAFRQLKLPDAWLVLVGGGEYLYRISNKTNDDHIIFTGNVTDPLRYVSRFDVGCLPSQIKTEGLPTVIIEYLYLGKPTIATNVGEVALMLDIDGQGPAGILISLGAPSDIIKEMKVALVKLYDDKKYRQILRQNTKTAVEKFSMDRCVNAYLAVYETSIRERV